MLAFYGTMQATMQPATLYALHGSVQLNVVGTLSGICIAPAQTIMGSYHSLKRAALSEGEQRKQQLRPATKPPLPKPFECNPGSSDKHLKSFDHFPGRSC
jgi:hypothetical protein